MKRLLFALLTGLLSTAALASEIDPGMIDMPWKNGPARDSHYKLAEHPNVVHVFEAWSISCSWCNRNAAQVKAMAAEYAQDTRVQFIDLGLDTNDRDYRSWIATHNPSYPVVQDVGQVVWRALRQDTGIPQTFVVACDGSLVEATIGYWGAAEKNALKAGIARAREITCE